MMISSAGIILPEGLLDRIERQTMRYTQHSEALRAAGRHLKRGLLLHGLPRTGKTLTAMYLAGAQKDRTVLLVTGRGQGLIEQYCGMARMLQPSTMIIEDIDRLASTPPAQLHARLRTKLLLSRPFTSGATALRCLRLPPRLLPAEATHCRMGLTPAGKPCLAWRGQEFPSGPHEGSGRYLG